MRVEQFEAWLRDHYVSQKGSRLSLATIGSRIANCKNVDAYEGDLDEHERSAARYKFVRSFQISGNSTTSSILRR